MAHIRIIKKQLDYWLKALFRVSKLSSYAEKRRGALAQVFKSLIEDAAVNTTILDAAVYAKYQLVDSALMNTMHADLQKKELNLV